MKRIGLLYLGKRGSATVENLEICKTLVKDNYLYVVLSRQIENLHEYYKLKEQYPRNLEILAINTYSSKVDFLFRSINIFRFIEIAWKIKKQKLDFIYIQMITYWGAILTNFLRNHKIVTAVHDPEMHAGEKDILFEILTKLCVHNSSNLVVFSSKFVDVCSRKFSFPKEKICVLKLGGYSYYKAESYVQNNSPVKFNRILFFGRISEYKGVGVLLEAMKKIKQNNSEIFLRIVGNGSFSEKEKLLISELGASVEVVNRWIKDEEVESFFENIDFVVLPYIEASQSGVVMLSYAMGKSVLATNVGALDEQINEETGLLVESNNIDSLIRGINKMYENDSYIKKGQKAFIYATQEWTWCKQAEKLLNFIQ